jgi:hypothetical protein
MLKLNLVSKETRQEVLLKRAYFLIKRVDLALITFSLFLAVVFFGANFIIEKNFQEYFSSSKLSKNAGQELNNDKISAINGEISAAVAVQKDFFPTSLLIQETTKLLTPGISLKQLRFDLDKKTAKISGLADSRENFLAFKNSLESSKIFTKVNSPITSLLQKKNIEFEISMELNLSQSPAN